MLFAVPAAACSIFVVEVHGGALASCFQWNAVPDAVADVVHFLIMYCMSLLYVSMHCLHHFSLFSCLLMEMEVIYGNCVKKGRKQNRGKCCWAIFTASRSF